MSKKDKLKFKKRIKSQIFAELSSQKSKELPSENIALPPSPQKTECKTEILTKSPVNDIKVDLKKSAIIISSIILAIIIIYFVDQKSGILLKISPKLFELLHISI